MAIEITIKSEKKVEEMLAEAREIMRALELPIGEGTDEEIIRSLMLTGLGLFRAHKRQSDENKMAAEMARQIQHGPRPTPEEAGLN